MQVTGLAPAHVPAWHVSVWVQELASLQAVPSLLTGLEQTPVATAQVPAVWHWSSAEQVTGLAPAHVPAWHVSVCVQKLASLHAVPSVLFGLEQTPVVTAQVPAAWHWSSAVQVTGLAPVHVPVWHVSVCVQKLASLHAVPFALTGLEQTPVATAQVPAVWHWSSAVQVTGLAPVHVPVWQVSVCVQKLVSLHAVPSLLTGLEQTPVATAQVPAVWHWSSAEQVTGLAPAHVPAWHVSVCVQKLASLHAVPSVLFGLEQTPVVTAQVPAAWHWSSAVQVTGLAPVHVPVWHVSVCVQKLASLHAVPFALTGLEQTPVATAQVPAVWHWSSAVQVTGLAPVHVPVWHVSVCVQAFPSLQLVPLDLFGLEQAPVAVLHVPMSWHWSDALQVTVVAGFAQEPVTLHFSPVVHALLSSQDVLVDHSDVPQDAAVQLPSAQALPAHPPGTQEAPAALNTDAAGITTIAPPGGCQDRVTLAPPPFSKYSSTTS